VANNERQGAAVGALAHRHAQVARLPGLYRHPRVQLAVVQRNIALVIDDEAAVVGVASGVALHNGEAAPDVVGNTSCFESRHFGPVQAAENGGVGVHRKAMQRILRKNHQIHGAQVAPGLGHHVANALGLRGQVGRGFNHGQLQLHQAHGHAVFRFV